MAQIAYYSNGIAIQSSGVGFYSSSFGSSIAVGSYNDRTFVTDSTGTVLGPELINNKYTASGSIALQGSGSINLLQVPNYQALINPRFTHSSAVQCQNVKLYGSDRISKNNTPSGIDIQAAQVIHAATTQSLSGSGNSTWTKLNGSGTVLSCTGGMGYGGSGINGTTAISTQHDWYLACSCSPNRIGASEAMLTFELEYL